MKSLKILVFLIGVFFSSYGHASNKLRTDQMLTSGAQYGFRLYRSSVDYTLLFLENHSLVKPSVDNAKEIYHLFMRFLKEKREEEKLVHSELLNPSNWRPDPRKVDDFIWGEFKRKDVISLDPQNRDEDFINLEKKIFDFVEKDNRFKTDESAHYFLSYKISDPVWHVDINYTFEERQMTNEVRPLSDLAIIYFSLDEDKTPPKGTEILRLPLFKYPEESFLPSISDLFEEFLGKYEEKLFPFIETTKLGYLYLGLPHCFYHRTPSIKNGSVDIKAVENRIHLIISLENLER